MVCVSTVCSRGTKTLASPEVGFIVPTKAMTSSGQKSVIIAKPAPVAAIKIAATSRRRSTIVPASVHSVQRRSDEARQNIGPFCDAEGEGHPGADLADGVV